MAGLLTIDPANPTPIYAQVGQALRAAIATGRLEPGAQLPTVRQLAIDLRVNANTVARVYLDLERDGVVETRRGIGTFVAARPPAVGGSKRGHRDPALRALARRWFDEAAARGFGRDDVARAVKALADEQGD